MLWWGKGLGLTSATKYPESSTCSLLGTWESVPGNVLATRVGLDRDTLAPTYRLPIIINCRYLDDADILADISQYIY